jgi:hypothetical protein
MKDKLDTAITLINKNVMTANEMMILDEVITHLDERCNCGRARAIGYLQQIAQFAKDAR